MIPENSVYGQSQRITKRVLMNMASEISLEVVPLESELEINKDVLFARRKTGVKGAQKNPVWRTMMAAGAAPAWMRRRVAALTQPVSTLLK